MHQLNVLMARSAAILTLPRSKYILLVQLAATVSRARTLFAMLVTSAMRARQLQLQLMPNLVLSALRVTTVPKVRVQVDSKLVTLDTTTATSVLPMLVSVLSVAKVKPVALKPPSILALTPAQVVSLVPATALRLKPIQVTTLLKV